MAGEEVAGEEVAGEEVAGEAEEFMGVRYHGILPIMITVIC